MEAFEPMSDSGIKQLLIRSSNAFCELDSMPAWLVKNCQAELIKAIINIVNISLKARVFPQSMKAALSKALIKKSNLDCNILSNVRPVSNLSYLKSYKGQLLIS